jgi:predicted HicB family RNase H-like nuclease
VPKAKGDGTVQVRVPRELWKRLRIEAVRRDMQLGTMVAELLARALALARGS